jgi:hypothetical protein
MDDGTPTERRLRKIVGADRDKIDSAPFAEARRNVINQLDAPVPDLEVIRRDIAIVLETKGYDGCFDRDALIQLSIGDALTANKERPAAKEAVGYVTQALLKVTKRESALHRTQSQLANSLLGDSGKGGGGRTSF